MANQILARLVGTAQNFFRIGLAGVRLKNDAGDLQVRNAGDTAFADAEAKNVVVHGSNASYGVVLSAPGSMGANVTYTLPATDGSDGQRLGTNGAGTLDWVDAEANGDVTHTEDFDQADDGTPFAIVTPPANATLKRITIDVESAAAGGSPTVAVGTSADPDAYVDETENDLTAAGLYIVDMAEELGETPSEIQITVTADSQTFSGKVYLTYTVAG